MKLNLIKNLYTYREMLKSQVKKDLRTRYKGSFIGFLWTFINPLLQLVIYSLVFRNILKIDIPNFNLFLFVGLLPWIFFSTSVISSSMNIVGNGNLIKKIYFPREILPISMVTGSLVNYLLGLIITILALIFSNIYIGKTILFLPLLIILLYVFIIGLSLIISSLNVYFRDIQHILEVLIMLGFYLTPVFYTTDIMPKEFEIIFKINIMAEFINVFRDILLYNSVPNFNVWIKLILISFSTFYIGILIFKKLEKRFAEEI